MAFKMKGGKDPMKKNFGSALNFNAGLRAASKAGKLDNNPEFKAAVDEAPTKAMKDNAPMMRMDNSAMKAMGKPAPVKKLTEIPPKPPKQQIQAKAGDKPKQYLKSTIKKDIVDKSRYTGRTPQSQMTLEELAKKKNIKNPQAT